MPPRLSGFKRLVRFALDTENRTGIRKARHNEQRVGVNRMCCKCRF